MKQSGKNAWAAMFAQLQRMGVDVLPRHFYSSIPDIQRLRTNTRWRSARSMTGVAGTGISAQLEFLNELMDESTKARLGRCDIHESACIETGAVGYGSVDADVLYAFVHSLRPQKIVQVGAGVATAVILLAAREAGYQPEVTAIDPFPSPYLRTAPIALIEDEAQDVPLETLTALSSGDLLFIDSTHTVRADSEVNRLVLEVLPRLSPGVWVHFHDIYFPYDYQRDILKPPLFFWSESTLVHAFLIGNPSFTIALSLSMLNYEASRSLADLVPRYQPELRRDGLGSTGGFPSSLYLVREGKANRGSAARLKIRSS